MNWIKRTNIPREQLSPSQLRAISRSLLQRDIAMDLQVRAAAISGRELGRSDASRGTTRETRSPDQL